MSGRSSDLLSRLPSVSELLEKPPVRDLVNQLNRSTVVAGARSYLEQVRRELQTRLAPDSIPSPRELAERAARYILGSYQHRSSTVVNATGRLTGHEWATVPLADRALDAMLIVGSGYIPQGRGDGRVDPRAMWGALCARSGAEAAVVVHSYVGALWLVLSALAAERDVLVARGQLGQLDESSLEKLIASSGAQLVEVGGTNVAIATDYEAAVGPLTDVVLRVRSDDYRVDGHTRWASREELVALARDRELVLIEALDGAELEPDATIADAASVGDPREGFSAAVCLSAGTDLVILRGNGLLGGPPCGLILGRRELVERVERHALFSAWQLDALRLAALAASLTPDTRVSDGQPSATRIGQLLETTRENLQHRAQRLAELICDDEEIESSVVTALEGNFTMSRAPERRLATYGVVITPREGRLESLQQRLAKAIPPVVGRTEAGQLVLDLRTVLPEQDESIAAALSIALTDRSAEDTAAPVSGATVGS